MENSISDDSDYWSEEEKQKNQRKYDEMLDEFKIRKGETQ